MGRGRRPARRPRVQLGPAAALTGADLQTYLRAAAAEGRERRVAGCFDVFIRPESPGPGSNYAIPHDGARPTAADVHAMVAAFESAHRLPRLEYLPATAPEAEAALVAHGFEVELRTSVMTCRPEELAVPPLPDGVDLVRLGADSTLEEVNAMVRVQAEAFGDPFTPLERRPLWLGHFIAVLALASGEPAGGGMCLARLLGTTELVGIAVAERARRRGIGTALTAELARLAFAEGAASAFLTPGDARATRVYARAGFRETGEMLHLKRP